MKIFRVVRPLRYSGHREPFGRHAPQGETDMKQLAQIVGSFWRNEDGQDLLEYALLVALIALVAVAGVTAAGLRVEEIFNAIVEAIPLPGA
jgi:Flp pilus assembly pilin Flp